LRVERFPDTIIAGMFNAKPAHLIEFDSAEEAKGDNKAMFR
jgi:hypothetical protein